MSPTEARERSTIDLVLVTGFLGAGKTTLVNRLVETVARGIARSDDEPSGDRGESASDRPALGLLINDFGRVVVDGTLVRERMEDDNLQVFEVADGSIFCSCKTANFVAGLRMFARLRPGMVVVEASGMSDPSGLSKILAENRLAGEFQVRRIICLVDAVRFPKLHGTLTAVERQVAGADLILLNKQDLVDEAALRSIEATLQKMNPEAVIERTSFAAIDPVLLDTRLSRELLGDVVSCSTPETRPAALQLVPGVITRERLDAVLGSILERAYRIKGWANTGDQWWYLSDNGNQLEWRESRDPGSSASGITVICAPEYAATIAEIWRESGVEQGTPASCGGSNG